MITLATFKLINTEKWIDPHFYDMPEEEPYSLSFKECGYDSTLLL